MKKILLLMMAIFALLSFNACSSENDPEPTNSENTIKHFPEPYLDFRVSSGVIKREMLELYPEAEIINGDGYVSFINLGIKQVKGIIYHVERGIVISAAMLVPVSYTVELAEFLANKYIQIGHDDEFTYFTNKEKTLAIGLSSYISGITPYWMVAYTEYNE